MISSNKLALASLAVVLAASAFFARSAIAGQPSHKNSHNHQNHNHNHGNKHSHNHHNHHHHSHFHQPHFGPVFVPPKPQVQVLFCVMVRQPSRFNDWNFHQVKCFGSSHEAEFFAATMRSRSGGDHGFMVRIDRKHW